MPAEVNGNHAVASFARARVYLRGVDPHSAQNPYNVCGNIIITPFFVFASGHGGAFTNFDPVVSVAIPREDVLLVVDHSVEACETHDQMDAEAKAQMEGYSGSAEESPED